MEFLLPHVEGRSTITNLSTSNDDDSTQGSEYQFSEESALSPPTIRSPTPGTSSSRPSVARASTPNSTASFTPRRSNKNDNDHNVLKEMVNVMKTTQEMRQKRATDMDDNDLFFLSMSKQLKKLPKTDQAEIKFQLHKLIHESEMNMLNNREQILNTPINIIGNQIIQNRNKILKPRQSTYTHIMTSEDENTQMNTSQMTTSLYNPNTNQTISYPILTQNEVSEVEAEQSQNEKYSLKAFYDNFGHEAKF